MLLQRPVAGGVAAIAAMGSGDATARGQPDDVARAAPEHQTPESGSCLGYGSCQVAVGAGAG